MYTSLEHYIDGNWVKPSGSKTQDVDEPGQATPIGELGHASKGDLDKALAAADKGFKTWRKVSAFERGKILRKAGRPRSHPRRRNRQGAHPGAGQGPGGSQARGAERRRHHRLVRRRGSARLRPHHSRPAPTACATW